MCRWVCVFLPNDELTRRHGPARVNVVLKYFGRKDAPYYIYPYYIEYKNPTNVVKINIRYGIIFVNRIL